MTWARARAMLAAVPATLRTDGRLWLAAVCLAMASPPALSDQAAGIEGAQEYRVKAAFLYNFSQFIEWPPASFAAANSPLSICVMGDDPFGESLQALQKRTYQARPIVVSYPKTVAEARKCSILYVDDAGKTHLGRDVGKALGDAPVLTVSSSEEAMASGICIGFLLQDGKIRWTLNLDAARRAHLKISAKLIEIAVAVVGETIR